MRFDGKTAWITGGNSGIGLETARLFIAEGANVAITGRNPQTLDAARELGPRLLPIAVDAADTEGLAAAAVQVKQHFGPIDVVFANAGVSGSTPLGSTTLEAFETIVRTNLTGVFFTVQAALPHLAERASIILNGSVHATLGVPGSSAYAASKAGVRAMVRNLASELSPRGIRVNVVVPGVTRTPIWSDRAPTPQAMQALEASLARAVPLAHMAEAGEVARAVLFLASSEASYVQAAELVVDGGMSGAPLGAPIFHPAA